MKNCLIRPAFAVALVVSLVACGGGESPAVRGIDDAGIGALGAPTASASPDPSSAEAAKLATLREEEQLAQDLYAKSQND